ncbi:MAG: bifunctional aspartate kinase/homoserine dehydrogenase I [Prevotellaceae bacterium]|nr:bifunctional aspartate kinase/homoserine dehydrogenase I [Prevotellaceae bacterium]
MKVLKFGGSSVGSSDGAENIKKIIKGQNVPLVVVVSALKTVTNNLIKVTELASEGNEDYKTVLNTIIETHHCHINKIIEDISRRDELKNRLGNLFDELAGILRGVFLLRDVTQKTADAIVSYGERCSSLIMQNFIEGSELFDSRNFIFTEGKGVSVAVDFRSTNKSILDLFQNLRGVAIVPGFIASDVHTGVTTTLGRGGSDYTAAIIAAALDAEVLEIWTDVDGFMTADPRIIPSAYTIEHLTYSEATELCNFGAKVIYPPTIFPVFAKKIPLYVRNTFKPDFKGSVINNDVDDECPNGIKGLTSIEETSIVTVSGMSMVGVIGINRRIFSILADNGISIFMVAQTSSETGTTLCMTPQDALKAKEVLSTELSKEIETGALNPIEIIDGLSTIAVVGETMKHKSGIAGRLFSVLGRNGVNVVTSAQGAQEMNISLVVERHQLCKALSVIHDSFFLSEYKVVNLFVCGIGTVGGSLLKQLREQHDFLMVRRRLRLNIVGVANSRRSYFNVDGIDTENVLSLLEEKGLELNTEEISRRFIDMDLYNSVFVDCTANPEVAALYENLLDNNISVVAANKIAASSPYSNYIKLKQTALDKGVKYLYETNVGAGLPIIKTISDLCDSGDEVVRIEAVLSGTLNYIFNKLSAENSFSETIKMAMNAGLSEPDPRQDLSGKDVVRKLVILAREAGYNLDLEDVELTPFMDRPYFEGSKEHFFEIVTNLDAKFEQQRRQLEEEGKKLRFVASWEEGKAEVSLLAVDRNHPFYHLEDSNNMVLLTTKRYKQYPMVIQGYGAGADVTAAGVFADIIRVANI